VQNSPLRLEAYFLKELKFSLTDDLRNVPDGSVKYDNINIDVANEVAQRDDDSRRWRCELTVRSTDQKELKCPYRFSITFVGFFGVAEEFPAERVEMMVRANAPALLYSAAREALMPITNRGPYPGMLLPSITFIEPPKPDILRKGGGKAKLPAQKGAARKSSKRK
jgi:preprotein translocase subunit SecB